MKIIGTPENPIYQIPADFTEQPVIVFFQWDGFRLNFYSTTHPDKEPEPLFFLPLEYVVMIGNDGKKRAKKIKSVRNF